MSDWRVEALPAVEAELGARLLARAFRDNPLNRAAIRRRSQRRRERSNVAGLRSQVPISIRHGRVLVARGSDGRSAGVLMATPPGAHPLPGPAGLARVQAAFGQGLRVAERWAEAYRILADHHPVIPHWYLDTLGVVPEEQGRGAGSALLGAFLSSVERGGTAAFLETDREENLGFYGRAGFAVEREVRVLGTPVWLMLRPPPEAAGSAAPASPSFAPSG